MPLIQRLSKYPHTIINFRLAASARFREAQILATHGKAFRLTSIYLLGYGAEMLLKAAYFRLQGWPPNQSITLNDLWSAKDHAKNILQLPWSGNLHYLPGWKDLLIQERHRQGKPYPMPFWRDLNGWITRLALNWEESLRYHDRRPYRGELRLCHEAVSWLFGQFRFL